MRALSLLKYKILRAVAHGREVNRHKGEGKKPCCHPEFNECIVVVWFILLYQAYVQFMGDWTDTII